MAEASAKRRKLTDFFQKLPEEPKEFPASLRRYQPTDVPRRPARPPKRPVGRPKKRPLQPADSQTSIADAEVEEKASARRGTYRTYSLRQKLEIVHYARQHSEAAASRHYGVSRSTIYGWKSIDKEPPIVPGKIVGNFRDLTW